MASAEEQDGLEPPFKDALLPLVSYAFCSQVVSQ